MRAGVRDRIDKTEKPWLVKSAGRILGPFSTDEVATKLRTREIVALDEIVSPLGLWGYVIDESIFTQLAKQMQGVGVEERTMTSTIDTVGQDDITKTVELDRFSAIYNKESKKNKQSGEERRASSEPVKTYGFKGDSNIEKEASGQFKLIWGLAFVLILGVVGWILTQEVKEAPVNDVQSLIQDGRQALKMGEYRRATDIFSQALKIEPSNTEVISILIPLVGQTQNDYTRARDLLKQLVALEEQSSDIFNLQGLIDLLEKNFSAAETALDRSIALDNRYPPSLINKLASQWLLGKTKSVTENFAHLESLGSVHASAILSYAFSQIEEITKKKNFAPVDQVIRLINIYLERGFEYRQELQLVKTYFQFFFKGNKTARNLESVLNESPYLSNYHAHDLSIYQENLNWTKLQKICQDIFDNSNGLVTAEVLLAFCLTKNGQYLKAQKHITLAQKKSPNYIWSSFVQAYLLSETKSEEKSLQILRHLTGTNPTKLGLAVFGENCRYLDLACDEQAWNQLLLIDSKSLDAISGLALIAMKRGNIEKAMALVKKGLSLSPNYFPLKKIEWQIEQAQ